MRKVENVGGPTTADRTDIASYVGSMSRDLSGLSLKNGLLTLAYLLEMASLEAEIIVGEDDGETGQRASDPRFR